MTTATMHYRPPKQRRSQESLERILDAAESLIRERGFEQMTITDVVQRSGSSVGSLYARFKDKLAILQAVQARYHVRVDDTVAERFTPDRMKDECLEDAARKVIEVLCDQLMHEPELFRAFFLQAILDPNVRAQGEAMNARRRERVAAVLLRHRDEINHPDPEAAARWFYQICMAVMRERLTFGPAAELSGGFSDDQLRAELSRTAIGYLLHGI
jgi:AcrR family transcriptional regulator